MSTAYENGERVAVADFDYSAVEGDRGNPLAAVLGENELPWDRLLLNPAAQLFLHRFSRVIMRIAGAKNSKMSAECFLIAIGDTSDEAVIARKITGTAKRHGVGKAAASKCCVDWCEFLGARPSAYMRSEAAKLSFQQHNPTRKKK